MSKHVHLIKEDIEEALISKDIVKLRKFNLIASSCVFCKRIWMKALAEQGSEVEEKSIDIIRKMNPGRDIPTGAELAERLKDKN